MVFMEMFIFLSFVYVQGSAAQEPILQSARSMLDSSTHLLKTARSLVINPKDPPTWSVLAGHSRTVSDSIKGLITAIRDKAPGQRECDCSIDNINRCIRNIEQASLAAVSQNLASRDDISLEVMIANETLNALLTHRQPPPTLSFSLYPSFSPFIH
uniref:Talin 1-like rod-segment domain-containing protein n=1 Tax=Hucho hucho TaxID=62062 RepID=A0A4W5LEW6_9TELE